MSEYAAQLNMPTAMKHMELRCKVTGMKQFKLRCAIGIFLIKVASRIIGCKVEVDLSGGNKPTSTEFLIDARGATDPEATAKAVRRAIQS